MHTKVIPNGVDSKFFYPSKIHPRNKIVIGSVGNLRTVKNHALILKACVRLLAQGKNIEVRIAGEGNQRRELMRLAKELDMQDRFFSAGQNFRCERFSVRYGYFCPFQ